MYKIGNYEVLNSRETKKLMQALKEQFCFEEKLNYAFLKNNKDKIYIINKEIDLLELEKLRIDALGLYIGKLYKDGFRLSIEGAQLIGKHCKCNILKINKKQKHDWLKGLDLEMNEDNGFYLIKSENDFLGCTKVKNNVALNTISSSRKLKVVNEQE